ncbi:MAG TPA: Hsp70 family protein [Jiangellaceae bacterium]
MTYSLGIDLGTTFSAAATWRDERAEICSLGDRSASVPSVVLLRDDSSFLTGDAAHRRGATEPQRVAREFKRRFGDPTPIILGGSPHSAEALTARLLRAIVDDVAEREGAAPEKICISHPANWGAYKKDLLQQTLRLAELDQPVEFATEPEAAAVFYATQRPLEPGAAVAVYDLGGGTFDAAIVRRTEDGFVIAGKPEGIERLGGVDFDAAVFNHVREALDGKLDELDEDDPAVVSAVLRLRAECVAAKEALSSDTDATIPVLLPGFTSEVRLTRTELETMVRPVLLESIGALRRTLDSAGVAADDLHAVLLVGGSSRMPIVAQLISAELGRPVVVDAHPKHAIALGAAWIASGRAGISDAPAPADGSQTEPWDVPPAPAATPAPEGQSAAERVEERTQLLSAFNARHVRSEPPPAAAAHPQRWASTPPSQQPPPTHSAPPRFVPAMLIGLLAGLAIGLVVLLLLPT